MVQMSEWALLIQWGVWGWGIVALAYIAWRSQEKAQAMACALVEAHEWVDEIIEALEDPDEEVGNKSVDRLVAQQRNDVGSVRDQREAVRGGPEE
jgi:hypothetical protein